MTTDTKKREDFPSKVESREGEPTVSYGPIPIQTAQDAAAAFLRGEISEERLREVCGKFGVLPGQLLPQTRERPDAPFENKLPDDLYLDTPAPKDDLEVRQKALAEKEEQREKANKTTTETPKSS